MSALEIILGFAEDASLDGNDLAKKPEPPELKGLTIIKYSAWGSTSSTELPIQQDRAIEYGLLCRQLLRTMHFRHHEKFIGSKIMDSLCHEFLKDAYWYFFLEHFALTDMTPFMETYRKEVAQKAYKDQQAATMQQAGFNPTQALSRAGVLLGKDSKKETRGRKRGPRPANSAPKEQTPIFGKVKQFVSKAEQLLEKPRHLLTSADAGYALRPKIPHPPRSVSSSPTRSDDNSEVSSVSSRVTIVSLGSTSSSSRTEVESCEVYRGRKELSAIGSLLLDAEVLSEPLPIDVTSLPKKEAQDLEAEAIEIVRYEQDHMVGRLARIHVELLQSMTLSQRNVFLPVLPDLLARLVVQVLHRSQPYARSLLSDSVKQHIKRTLTFWIHGVENASLALWNTDPIAVKERHEEGRLLDARLSDRSTALLRRRYGEARFPLVTAKPSTKDGIHKQFDVAENTDESPLKPAGAQRWREARPNMTKMVRTAGVVSNLAGDLSYSKGLEEMRQAFDEMRRGGSKRTDDMPQGSSAEDEARSFSYQFSSRSTANAPRRFGRSTRPNKPLERHAFFHRHAAVNKRSFWNEIGKRRGSTSLPHGPSFFFNMQDISPLLQRFYRDNDLDIARLGPSSLMEWSQ